jgi:hypothetical protein
VQGWKNAFEAPITRWLDWFWKAYESEWRRAEEVWHDACEEQFQVRIERIVSLAYDTDGEEYEVPIVIHGDSASPADSGESRDGGRAIGFE